jgi:hypothetical protein
LKRNTMSSSVEMIRRVALNFGRDDTNPSSA